MPAPPPGRTLSERKANSKDRCNALDRWAPTTSSGLVPTAFRALVDLCEGLVHTRSRLALAEQVAGFLAGLEADEVRPAVRLLLGQAGRGEAATSGRTLWRVLVRLAGNDAAPAHAWEGSVDFGEAAERLLLAARGDAAARPALSLVEVEARIQALGAVRGPGARGLRERQLTELLDELAPVEV